MPRTLPIESSGRRVDRIYLGCLVVFWIIWTPLTAFVTILAIRDFSYMLLLWLVFGYLGVFSIPFVLWSARKPQKLIATAEALIVEGTGIPFRSRLAIPREDLRKLHFGYSKGTDGESESIPTLSLFFRGPWWCKRIMLGPLAHPTEKRKIYEEVAEFLRENEFTVEVADTHEPSRPKDAADRDLPPGSPRSLDPP